MLYIGTTVDLSPESGTYFRIEPVAEQYQSVRQWFSQPVVYFLGAHTGCSCGFPSVTAESPIEYFEGMLPDTAERAADLHSVRALIDLLTRVVTHDGRTELYPVWNGEEEQPPKGVIELDLGSLVPERFFFNERFMHTVSRLA